MCSDPHDFFHLFLLGTFREPVLEIIVRFRIPLLPRLQPISQQKAMIVGASKTMMKTCLPKKFFGKETFQNDTDSSEMGNRRQRDPNENVQYPQ